MTPGQASFAAAAAAATVAAAIMLYFTPFIRRALWHL